MSVSWDPFDLNGDGKLDFVEKALEFQVFNEIMNGSDEEKESADDDID